MNSEESLLDTQEKSAAEVLENSVPKAKVKAKTSKSSKNDKGAQAKGKNTETFLTPTDAWSLAQKLCQLAYLFEAQTNMALRDNELTNLFGKLETLIDAHYQVQAGRAGSHFKIKVVSELQDLYRKVQIGLTVSEQKLALEKILGPYLPSESDLTSLVEEATFTTHEVQFKKGPKSAAMETYEQLESARASSEGSSDVLGKQIDTEAMKERVLNLFFSGNQHTIQ